jgi:hypothetical protein
MRRTVRIVVALLIVLIAVIDGLADRKLPVYIAELSNLNDYCLFANSGWDGNWYVGFNVCWMEQLPSPPPGDYSRAFIGVKLGRMKTYTPSGKPSWEKEPIPGSIYVAVASTSAWKSSQKHLLTDTRDIPLEGDQTNALEGVGESCWFWTEVPLSEINYTGPNFVALWSPTEYLINASSSPIIAGGWGSQKVNSWMNSDVKGYAPLTPSTALKTPITMFEPAIALKLIPAGSEQNITVTIDSIKDGRYQTPQKTVTAAVSGDGIEKAWLELSSDGVTWEKHGRCVYQPPFMFTLKPLRVAPGSWKMRCSASDVWGNAASSEPVEIKIEPVVPK